MIVDPDFVDHWKTRMLVGLLGEDEVAPLYVIRLWAHCQNRREWVFELPVPALKAICRYPGDAQAFERAMVECGFVARDGNTLSVVDWDVYNASLIAAWTNGGKGGRPRNNPDENPPVNPPETQGKPSGEPIRGDEIGGEGKGKEPKARASASPKRARSPKIPLPSDFAISDRVRTWAAEKGYAELDRHFEGFVSKCKAKGYTYADWDEGLMGAIRDDWAKLRPQPRASPPAGRPDKFDPVAHVNRNRIRA